MISRSSIALTLVFSGTLAGCPSSTTSSIYTPITSIVIPSAALYSGRGCGDAQGEVYRYAALVYSAEDSGPLVNPPVASGIFECYTDGVFSNLSTSAAVNFVVLIYAYDQADYQRAGFPQATLGCPLDGGACPGEALTTDTVPAATWTTACTVTELSGTPSVAVCPPLTQAGGSTADGGGTDEGGPEAAAGEAAPNVADAAGSIDSPADAAGE